MQVLCILRRMAVAAALLMPQIALSEGRSIIVLDASGSMWGQIGGQTKLEIARASLTEVLKSIPPETELGLIAYGHREKGSCADIELIVPPAAGTAQAISDAAANLQFLGKTPLTDAVRMAAAELRSTEEKATVILITDGIETCDADPCALGLELEASGVDFTAHVVGFGLTEDEGKQVSCLATNTGGLYITAADMAGLTDALQTTVLTAVDLAQPEPEAEPEPVAAALEFNFAPTALLAPGVAVPDDPSDLQWEIHNINADGTTGERVLIDYNDFKTLLKPGTYRVMLTIDKATAQQDVTVTAEVLARPEIVLNAAKVLLHPKGAADGPIEANAGLQFSNAAGLNTTYYGDTRIYLNAGDTILTASLGSASVTETLTLTPGQILDRDVIIGSGVAVVNAYYVEGMIIESGNLRVDLFEAKMALDGSRKQITTDYGPGKAFTLPPGDYLATVSIDVATIDVPFTAKLGERVEVTAILQAGVLFAAAPGAYSIEVFAAKPALDGSRKSLNFDYTQEKTLTVPGGDYLVVATRDGGVPVEATVTVTAGERGEVALNLP